MTKRVSLPSETEIRDILKTDAGELPSFPQAAAKLLEAAGDDTASMADLSRIMETDPGLSAQVLKIVNSAVYSLGRKITTLSESVLFLGLDEVRHLAMGVNIFRDLFKKGGGEHFDRLLFWRHSLAVAVLSRKITEETGGANPEEAYMAGLLHDIGKIFLDLGGRESYADFIRHMSTGTDHVAEAERGRIGLGHDDIGAYFCASWNLPASLVMAVKYHHQPFAHEVTAAEDRALISAVSLANFLTWTQGMGSFDFIRPPILAPEVEATISLEKIDIVACILSMNEELERISAFYGFVFPSAEQLRENLLWANLRLSRLNTRYYFQDPPLMKHQDTAPKTEKPLAFDVDLEFAKPLSRARSVKEALDIVMYHIGRIFEPKHWCVLLKDPKTSNLVFSVVVGGNRDKLQGAKLPKGEGIAGYIMETGESVIVKDVSKDSRFSSRVDKYTGFETRSVIGAPLKTEGKIFGVIELVNRVGNTPFSDSDLHLLSSIAEFAAIAIERSYYTQALTNLATKDPVTGLKNRWSFERAAGSTGDFKIQYGSIFSMLIITVDNLAELAVKTGRKAMDEALKALAQIMNRTKRRDDTLFRYGEETFLMLLPLTYSEEAKATGARIETEIFKAVSGKTLAPLSVTIAHHTLSQDEVGSLVNLVGEKLSASEPARDETPVPDIEESLQPLVEKEEKTDAASPINFGKAVSLGGHYVHPRTRSPIHIRLERLSMLAVTFRIPKSQRLQPNDYLDIQFVLDDLRRSVIKRRVVVREVEDDLIRAEFYNPPPYAKTLGFYLMK